MNSSKLVRPFKG